MVMPHQTLFALGGIGNVNLCKKLFNIFIYFEAQIMETSVNCIEVVFFLSNRLLKLVVNV